MQEGFGALGPGGQAKLGHHAVFLVQAKSKVEQLGLVLPNEPCHRYGGPNVGQRIVRRLVAQAVGARNVFQLETGPAIGLLRPDNTFGAQRVGQPNHIEQVPAAAAVLPFPRVGVDEVAPEQKARELVVKADGVVAHAHGARLGQLRLYDRRKLPFGQAAFQTKLGRDARDQATLRVGQVVRGRAAVHHQRLAHFVQLGIRADAGELGGPVPPWADAEGLVVVPEEGVRHQPAVASSGSVGSDLACLPSRLGSGEISSLTSGFSASVVSMSTVRRPPSVRRPKSSSSASAFRMVS